MANPFTEVTVTPDHLSNHCRIAWDVTEPYKDSLFFVQWSSDGVQVFRNISGPPSADMFEFIDTGFNILSPSDIRFYRVVLIKGEETLYSQVISTFQTLKPREFKTARHIMNLEKIRIRKANGVGVQIRKRVYGGEKCGHTDETGLKYQISECPLCFGTGIKGGYSEPIGVFIEILNTNENQKGADPSGLGVVESSRLRARILAYPKIDYGDIVIFPGTSRIYSVENVITHHFKGITPVTRVFQMTEISYSDIRHKLLERESP